MSGAAPALPSAYRNAPLLGTVAAPVYDPKAYAVTCEGDCLAPVIGDGDTIIVSPSVKVGKGMIVAMNFKDGRQSKIKRLADDPPKPPTLNDEAASLWTLEMDNPKRRFFVRQADVESVHAVAGILRKGRWIPLTEAT